MLPDALGKLAIGEITPDAPLPAPQPIFGASTGVAAAQPSLQLADPITKPLPSLGTGQITGLQQGITPATKLF